MINILDAASEIGLWETARVLSRFAHDCFLDKITEEYPCPEGLSEKDVVQRQDFVCDRILRSGKKKVLLLTPEIGLLETCARRGTDLEFIIAIPCDMGKESRSRVAKNMPHGVTASFLDEPGFPGGFIPKNGCVLATGYRYSDRVILLPQVYRLQSMFRSFCGKKVFVPISPTDIGYCPSGWISEFPGGLFNDEW